jgi:carbon-monoxide dehydrogenase small subunit
VPRTESPTSSATASAPHRRSDEAALGLGGKQPNIEIKQSFVIARPRDEVWAFFADPKRVAPCMPGATLTAADGDRLEGQVTVKLGPIAAAFAGEARMERDEARRCGRILGAGRDRLGGSRANAEIEYVLNDDAAGAATRVDVTVRALLLGPLAQFGRSSIVNDLAARLTEMFAHNLERRLAGGLDPPSTEAAPLTAASLLGSILRMRIRRAAARLLAKFRR